MRRRTFFFSGLVSLALGACLSPTLPVPPPDAPEQISLGDDGFWDVRGRCTPGALVLVKNLDTGAITGVEDRDANGRYFVRVEGEICARAEIWEIFGDDVSGKTFFVLEPVTASEPTDACSLPG